MKGAKEESERFNRIIYEYKYMRSVNTNLPADVQRRLILVIFMSFREKFSKSWNKTAFVNI